MSGLRFFSGLTSALLLTFLFGLGQSQAQSSGWMASNAETQIDTLVLTHHIMGSPGTGTYTFLNARSLNGGTSDTLSRYLGLYSQFQYLPDSQRFVAVADVTGEMVFIDRNFENREPVNFENAPGGMSYFNGTRLLVADEQAEHFFYYQRNVPMGVDGLFYFGINDSVRTPIYTNVQQPSQLFLDHDNLILYALYNNNNGTMIRYTHDTGITDTLTVSPSRVNGLDIHTGSGTVLYFSDGRIYRSNLADLAQREEISTVSTFSQAGTFTPASMHYDHDQNRVFVAFRVNTHLNELFEIRLNDSFEVTEHVLPNHGFIQSMVYFEDTNSLISLGAGMMNLSNSNIFLEYSFDSGFTHVPGANETQAMVFDRQSGYIYELELTFNRTAHLITRTYPDGSGRELVAWMPMNSQANRFMNTIRIDETGRRLLYSWINDAGNEYIGSINLNNIREREVIHEFETEGPRMIASFDFDEVNNTFYYMHFEEGFYACDAAFESCSLHWARGNDTYSQFDDLNNGHREIQMKVVPESNHLFFFVRGVGIRYVNLDNAQEAGLFRATSENAILRNLQYNPDLQWLTTYEQIGFQRNFIALSLPNAENEVFERLDSGNLLNAGLVVVFDPSVVVSIDEAPLTTLPTEVMLGQNFPNPFNPTTRIPFTLQESVEVTLDVFDITGRRVATLVNGFHTAGTHTVSFDGAGLSSGIYIYRLTAGSRVETRAMTLIK